MSVPRLLRPLRVSVSLWFLTYVNEALVNSVVPLRIERLLHLYQARRGAHCGPARLAGKGRVLPSNGYRIGFHIPWIQTEQTTIPYREPTDSCRRHLS